MALSSRSLFLYGFQVTELNSSFDFRAVSAETPRLATLNLGYYSLTSLLQELVRAIQAVDQSRVYTATVDRTVGGGSQNRVTISSSGTYFQILGATGPRVASSCLPLFGFSALDYSGALTYMSQATAGTSLSPSYIGYNYMGPDDFQEVDGTVSRSASGIKEAIVFSVKKYWQVEFKNEPKANLTAWRPFMQWLMLQRPIDFTPEISAPATVYQGTIDKTESNGNGLAFKMKEQLSQMPNFYGTGLLTFQVKE